MASTDPLGLRVLASPFLSFLLRSLGLVLGNTAVGALVAAAAAGAVVLGLRTGLSVGTGTLVLSVRGLRAGPVTFFSFGFVVLFVLCL